MKVSVINNQKALPISKKLISNQVKAILMHMQILTDEICIHYVDKKSISVIHNQFFQDFSPTDCISLLYDTSSDNTNRYNFLGEIFICTEIAIEYAKKESQSPQEEITLYLVHGLLHLIGYDDIKKEDRIKMRKQEKICLDLLSLLDLLPKDTSHQKLNTHQ